MLVNVIKSVQTASFAAFLLACSSATHLKPTTSEAQVEPVGPARTTQTCTHYPTLGGTIAVCNLESPGSFRVRNESTAQVQMVSRVDVELEDETERWRATDALVYLDPVCRREPPSNRCVGLEPGVDLQPYSWSGFSCSGQCRPRCAGDHYLRGWWLRFVVSTCDGQYRLAGPPFRLLEYEDVPL